jgi:hypothetical protein
MILHHVHGAKKQVQSSMFSIVATNVLCSMHNQCSIISHAPHSTFVNAAFASSQLPHAPTMAVQTTRTPRTFEESIAPVRKADQPAQCSHSVV